MSALLIEICEFKLPVRIGVSAAERAHPQLINFDLHLSLDSLQAGVDDEIASSVDYDQVLQYVGVLTREGEWKLLEKLVTDLCRSLLLQFPLLQRVQVRAAKRRFVQASEIALTHSMERQDL